MIFSCLIAFTFTAPALAGQREYSTGVNHIKIYNPPAQESAEENATDNPEEDAATRVWNKYKALAMGTADKEKKAQEATPEVKAPVKPEPPQKPQKTGMVSLIETYQQNKENRRDMKSLSFNRAETKQE